MEKCAFEVEVSNESGDFVMIHVSEDMSALALVEQAVRQLFPQASTPITEYSLSVDGELYSKGSWQGKKVGDLGIKVGLDVLLFGPSPKGSH